jgi:hypothetical protein
MPRLPLAAGCWLLAAGCWLLAAGCWLLAADCWLLVYRVDLISPYASMGAFDSSDLIVR